MNMNTHRVAIVGAGAAGLSAAYAFSKHPDKFTAIVFEKEHVAGGMASSMNIDPKLCGASYINDGVQGCSPAFANTLRIFRELGYPPQKVDMQCVVSTNPHAYLYLIASLHFPPVHLDRISFGKGEHFWTNVFPSPLTERFAADVRKFGRVLNIVKLFEIVLALLPIYALLRLFRLSKDFGERMVYPLAALFFGTGNQTPYVASVILVGAPPTPLPFICKRSVDRNAFSRTRVCAYLNMTSVVSLRAFPRCTHSRRSGVVFPGLFSLYLTFTTSQLSDTYTAWQHKTEEPGNVTFLLGHVVTRVVSRTKKRTVLEFLTPSSNERQTAEFDSLILATDADNALTILGKEASWMERRVLGGVKYLHDLTVTHTDVDYMRKVPSFPPPSVIF
jgi:hypothetical protein